MWGTVFISVLSLILFWSNWRESGIVQAENETQFLKWVSEHGNQREIKIIRSDICSYDNRWVFWNGKRWVYQTFLTLRSFGYKAHWRQFYSHGDWLGLCDVNHLINLYTIHRSPENVMKWIPSDQYRRFQKLEDELKLAAYLIQEQIKGEASKWKEWLQVGNLQDVWLKGSSLQTCCIVVFFREWYQHLRRSCNYCSNSSATPFSL